MAGKLYKVLIALIAIIFGIVWMTAASSVGAPGFFSLFGVVFIAVAFYILIKALFSK